MSNFLKKTKKRAVRLTSNGAKFDFKGLNTAFFVYVGVLAVSLYLLMFPGLLKAISEPTLSERIIELYGDGYPEISQYWEIPDPDIPELVYLGGLLEGTCEPGYLKQVWELYDGSGNLEDSGTSNCPYECDGSGIVFGTCEPSIFGLDPGESLLWVLETGPLGEEKDKTGFFLIERQGDQYFLKETEKPDALVYGIYPDPGTEITDLNASSTFEIGWQLPEDYDGLLISFLNPETGIQTAGKFIEPIEALGSAVLDLASDFNFEKNGDWFLHALAYFETPEISGGFLTGRWITEYTDNIADPDYFLKINDPELPGFFSMQGFNEWYSENVDRFDEPTAVFLAITDIFGPIYSRIGEFGSRIVNYFDPNKAYATGYDLGKAVPVFDFYLSAVSDLLGGFPLKTMLITILFLMAGLVVFKLVVIFIPMIG